MGQPVLFSLILTHSNGKSSSSETWVRSEYEAKGVI